VRKTSSSVRHTSSACKELRVAGEEGLESFRLHGPQLESDDEFDAFMDVAEADALRQ
jgi:hypothetical protein